MQATDLLFTHARTFNHWTDRPVTDAQIAALYDLVRLGPTSANCAPARFCFIRTPEGKARLAPALSKGNLDKTMTAPVTVLVGTDAAFYDKLPELFPHTDARPWFTSSPEFAQETAFRNSSLQGGYLIMAARAMGLDCGPLSGFDGKAVDAAFFAGTAIRTNFIVNIGYGDPSGTHDRLPRLDFAAAATLA